MAQASSAQREPSMEEILASIRRIIEDNDAGRKQADEPVQARPEQGRTAAQAAGPTPASAERTVIEVDAFRNELRTPIDAMERAPEPREATQRKPVTLVKTVVVRNTAVHPASLFPRSMPSRTTKPEKMPIRLMIVCTVVKVENDMPKIMPRPF